MTARRPTREGLLRKYRFAEPVYVTRPRMPALCDFTGALGKIWEDRRLTNNGPYARELERQLAEYLGVEHLSLFCNGTTALLIALHALRITSGEVITTPFTFPATVHVLYWNGIRPVFCDVDERTLNLDPRKVEQLIGQETKAILPVHVYGNPCDVDAIREIADRHGLAVIYDAAHAFGVRRGGRSLADFGDMSMLSFHATKLFSTIEGGALVVSTEARRRRVESLRNFGIVDEENVIGPGINGKMNEFQAAYGLLQLEMVDREIADRAEATRRYREGLAGVPGITFMSDLPGVKHNYGYFPILVDPGGYGLTRDGLHDALREFRVMTRKYFHPLCSHYPCYSALPSARPENLPVAERAAASVLCLPLYGDLEASAIERICCIIAGLAGTSPAP